MTRKRTPFPDRLLVELLPNGSTPRRVVTVKRPFSYVRPNGERVTVPVGRQIDFVSRPRFSYRLLGPPLGADAESSAIHDHLWMVARERFCPWGLEFVESKERYAYANLVFDEALKDQFDLLVAETSRPRQFKAAWYWFCRKLQVWCVRHWAKQEIQKLLRGEKVQ